VTEPLTAELIIKAYKQGIFPMDTDDGLRWFAPDPRCIIDLDHFHVSKRLARKYRQGAFIMKIDTAWNEVLSHCANRKETWISDEIKSAYTELYRQGQAHSIEAYNGNKLAGGLYGVSLGGAFMAESMFHLETDASKFCLVYLVEHLKKRGFTLLDTQDFSMHKARFGAILVSKAFYLEKLAHAIELDCQFLG
jgi:leucyl/phenylalanyl-tRNA---protein transferase